MCCSHPLYQAVLNATLTVLCGNSNLLNRRTSLMKTRAVLENYHPLLRTVPSVFRSPSFLPPYFFFIQDFTTSHMFFNIFILCFLVLLPFFISVSPFPPFFLHILFFPSVPPPSLSSPFIFHPPVKSASRLHAHLCWTIGSAFRLKMSSRGNKREPEGNRCK